LDRYELDIDDRDSKKKHEIIIAGLLDKEIQNKISKISIWITKAHKPCLEGKGLIGCTWCEIELTLERLRASDSLDQKRH
jgi:hypothetical protein